MTIEAGSIAPDSTTYVAPTGGTPEAISVLDKVGGKTIANFDSETDHLTRTLMEFSTKAPVVLPSAPGGYSQLREEIFVKIPMTLANGNRTVCTGSVKISRDPEMTTVSQQALRLLLCDLLGNTAFDAFWVQHAMG
jgi:hypothetical protein